MAAAAHLAPGRGKACTVGRVRACLETPPHPPPVNYYEHLWPGSVEVSGCYKPKHTEVQVSCNGTYWPLPDEHNGRPAWKKDGHNDPHLLFTDRPRFIFYSAKYQKWYISNCLEDNGWVWTQSDAPNPYGVPWIRGITCELAQPIADLGHTGMWRWPGAILPDTDDYRWHGARMKNYCSHWRSPEGPLGVSQHLNAREGWEILDRIWGAPLLTRMGGQLPQGALPLARIHEPTLQGNDRQGGPLVMLRSEEANRQVPAPAEGGGGPCLSVGHTVFARIALLLPLPTLCARVAPVCTVWMSRVLRELRLRHIPRLPAVKERSEDAELHLNTFLQEQYNSIYERDGTPRHLEFAELVHPHVRLQVPWGIIRSLKELARLTDLAGQLLAGDDLRFGALAARSALSEPASGGGALCSVGTPATERGRELHYARCTQVSRRRTHHMRMLSLCVLIGSGGDRTACQSFMAADACECRKIRWKAAGTASPPQERICSRPRDGEPEEDGAEASDDGPAEDIYSSLLYGHPGADWGPLVIGVLCPGDEELDSAEPDAEVDDGEEEWMAEW
eukprot:gene1559-biopygen79540